MFYEKTIKKIIYDINNRYNTIYDYDNLNICVGDEINDVRR